MTSMVYGEALNGDLEPTSALNVDAVVTTRQLQKASSIRFAANKYSLARTSSTQLIQILQLQCCNLIWHNNLNSTIFSRPMDSETEYLATKVLIDERDVSYRQLSRHLKVHCDKAKKILYKFQHTQNEKRAGSVRACYILDGIVRLAQETNTIANGDNGNPADDPSSPVPSSSLPQGSPSANLSYGRKIMVAGEEVLDAALKTYESVSSCHIYSLRSSPQRNMQVLSNCNRELTRDFLQEDPLVFGPRYGVVRNRQTNRRKAMTLDQKQPTAQKGLLADHKQVQPTAQAASITHSKQPSTLASADSDSHTPSGAKPGAKPSSRIAKPQVPQLSPFAAFAKPKTASQKSSTDRSRQPLESDPVEKQDARRSPSVSSNSEGDDTEDVVDRNVLKASSNHKSKAQRVEELLKMMDDVEEGPANESQGTTSKGTIAVEDDPPRQNERSTETVSASSSGRRRGRRRVTRKVTTKDDEGFLVTREEPGWESFSEEDTPTQSLEGGAQSISIPAKRATGHAKAAQGKIMSFFGKR